MDINESDKKIVASILKKGEKQKAELKDRMVIIDFPEFYESLNSDEVEFCKKIMTLDPRTLGFKGELLGLKDVPSDLVAINDQSYRYKDEVKTINTQFLPRLAYEAAVRLQESIKSDLGKSVFIDSAYRSPAYQLFLFLFYLDFHKYDLNKVASRVALPGYSEHGDVQTALDFITEDGVPTDDDPRSFEDTQEYKWLLENAGKFGFQLSYPKDNKLGVIFEPWHWRFKGE